MKWLALILIMTNLAAFFLLRADSSQSAAVDLPRPVGSARLILIDELNFTERNELRIGDVEETDDVQVEIVTTDDFNLLRQPDLAAIEGTTSVSEPDLSELEGFCEVIDADQAVISTIVERLQSVGTNPYLVEQVISNPGPLMVYITPFASAREAALELNVLRSEDIESFIIPEGELQNGISVGVFSTEQNALARSVELDALGYETDLYQYTIEELEYSINLPRSESVVLSPDYWAEFQSDFPSMTRVQNSCF